MKFLIPTKRVFRIQDCLPKDWSKEKYSNVYISCTVENQVEADNRLKIYTALDLPHFSLQLEPLLSRVDLQEYITTVNFEKVVVEGEFGKGARECRYEWVYEVYCLCKKYDINFEFRRTGDKYINSKGIESPKRARGFQYEDNEGLIYQSRSAGVLWE